MFCVKCGADAVKRGFFCKSHMNSGKYLFHVNRDVIYFCRGCSRFHIGEWSGSAEDTVEKSIKHEQKIKARHIEIRNIGNKLRVKATLKGYMKEQTENFVIPIKKHMCRICVKMAGGYYEAVIQIRGPSEERILKKIKQATKPEWILSINQIDDGYDIRFIHKKDCAIVLARIRKGFEVKDTYKLVGEKKGRKLYRNYYCIR